MSVHAMFEMYVARPPTEIWKEKDHVIWTGKVEYFPGTFLPIIEFHLIYPMQYVAWAPLVPTFCKGSGRTYCTCVYLNPGSNDSMEQTLRANLAAFKHITRETHCRMRRPSSLPPYCWIYRTTRKGDGSRKPCSWLPFSRHQQALRRCHQFDWRPCEGQLWGKGEKEKRRTWRSNEDARATERKMKKKRRWVIACIYRMNKSTKRRLKGLKTSR